MEKFIDNSFKAIVFFIIVFLIFVLFAIVIFVFVNYDPNYEVNEAMRQVQYCMTEYEFTREQCIALLAKD